MPEPQELQALLGVARITWGQHPLNWPVPPRIVPRFFPSPSLSKLRSMFGPLDQAALTRWWAECEKGQSAYEDAGSYYLRCYTAMLGWPVEEPYTYAEALRALSQTTPEETSP